MTSVRVHQSPNSRCSDCSSCSDFFKIFGVRTVRAVRSVRCSGCSSNFEIFSVRCSVDPGFSRISCILCIVTCCLIPRTLFVASFKLLEHKFAKTKAWSISKCAPKTRRFMRGFPEDSLGGPYFHHRMPLSMGSCAYKIDILDPLYHQKLKKLKQKSTV